jgi:hypothetical protein
MDTFYFVIRRSNHDGGNMQDGDGDPNKRIWKAKNPLKIKIFMWLVNQNAILTKDNLVKRNWQGNHRCSFCNLDEFIMHIFFDCYLARYVWS